MRTAIKLLVIFALIIQFASVQAGIIQNSNPSEETLKEVQKLIDQGNELYGKVKGPKEDYEKAKKGKDKDAEAAAKKRYEEVLQPAEKKFNEAIDAVIKAFKMDETNVSDAKFSDKSGMAGFCTLDREVRICPNTFKSLSWLVSVLKHEIFHANQMANGRSKLSGESDEQARARREVEAYDAQVDCASTTGLDTPANDWLLDFVVANKKVEAYEYEAAKAGEPSPYVKTEKNKQPKMKAIWDLYDKLREGEYTREGLIEQAHEKLANMPPTLEEGKVSPDEGASDEKFSYTIHYFDVDNSQPAYVDVWIDDHSYPMEKADPEDMDYTDGCEYEYSTELVPGTHTYYFRTSDWLGYAVYPEEGAISGPIVSEEPTAVTASGQHLQAVFDPADIDSVKLAVEKTPAPYEPELWESRASVSDWTEGFLTLSYTDVNGEGIWLEQDIHINNTTKEILGRMLEIGVDTITVGAIFGPLPSISGEEDMTLTLDFSYPISITMGPVFQLQLQAGIEKYVTDKGREVEVFDDGRPNDPDVTEEEADAVLDDLGLKDKVEKKAGPSDSYDCHGWTFTCGKKWINNDQVQKILDDNGYSKTTKPKVGDIAVYRDSNGDITHTGVVREVDENGNVVDVESKWGALGRYDHKPGDVPPNYGTPEYHHTDRQGEGEGKDRHTIKTE